MANMDNKHPQGGGMQGNKPAKGSEPDFDNDMKQGKQDDKVRKDGGKPMQQDRTGKQNSDHESGDREMQANKAKDRDMPDKAANQKTVNRDHEMDPRGAKTDQRH